MFAKHRTRILFFVRVFVSAIVVYVLLTKIPLNQIWVQLKDANIAWLLALLLLSQISMIQQALRWRSLILAAEEDKPSRSVFYRYTALGFFYNLFLPTGFGGDAVKSISLGKSYSMVGSSIAATAISRLLGLISLFVVFWLALFFGNVHSLGFKWKLTMGVSGGVFVALLLLMILAANHSIWNRYLTRFRTLWEIRSNLASYSTRPGLLIRSFFDSFLIQIVIFSSQWMMFRCIGTPIPIQAVFIVVPIVTIATMLPISFYGIGVRELVSVSLYSSIWNIPSDVALSAGLLGYVVVIFQALQGGYFFLFAKKNS